MPQLATVLLQIAVILAAARIAGRAAAALRQPQVIGEMVAGILLGPSFFGWLAPRVHAAVFPADGLGGLTTLSQIGIVLFMFTVGLEMDLQALRHRRRVALVVSHASIAVPFLLGAGLAVALRDRLSDGRVPVLHFALFMGTAMSITAFPVLARILAERRLLRTPLGSVALACAAVDDVTAWCILAAVVFLARAAGAALPAWVMAAGVVAYALAMAFAVRPLLDRVHRARDDDEETSRAAMAAALIVMLVSAWTTETLGVHALFGAFFAGAVMPRRAGFADRLAARLSGFTVVFLLPLFFALTGLRTRLSLVQGAGLWMAFALILAVAVAGKWGASTLAARLTGMPWGDAHRLGLLMNTRGLMELVVLTIGLDIGVIGAPLFAMMVLMALATTVMTAPFLDRFAPAVRPAARRVPAGGTG